MLPGKFRANEVKIRTKPEPSVPMDSSENAEYMRQVQSRISELTVLESELSSLKKSAKLYKQQPNSYIYFLAQRKQLRSETKKELEKLKATARKVEAN